MTHATLRSYFDHSNETQRDFAARVGVSQSYISKVLVGEAVPSLPVAIRIANAAGIPVESLLPPAEAAAS